ncbi:MAG TPA: GlsB/YeaQ/YmgE family stress response membrane protein [Abditibacteriaceae bacterium]
MGLWDFLLLLVVASIIGALGQAIAGFSTPGCLMSAIIGFVGAFIGRWLQAQFKMPEFLPVKVGDTTFPVVWSVIGAAVLVLLLRLLLGRRSLN